MPTDAAISALDVVSIILKIIPENRFPVQSSCNQACVADLKFSLCPQSAENLHLL